MTNHLTPALDACISMLAVLATATAALSGPTANAEQYAEMQLLIMPLIGGIIVSSFCIMLNPNPETRRIVIGRAMAALFFGSLSPQLIGMIHPSLASLGIKPVFLLLVGGSVSGLVYILVKPFTKTLYEKADDVAKAKAEEILSKIADITSKTSNVTIKVDETKQIIPPPS